MSCDDTARLITSYLDGDLDDATASALRGHLRTCAACHALADEHAQVRDAIAELPTPEPPAALWQGVMAKLGDAEVADAQRPRWWRVWQRLRPQLGPALAIAATTAAVGLWIGLTLERRGDHVVVGSVVTAPAPRAPVAPPPQATHPAGVVDVEADLAQDDARIDQSYATAATDLMTLAADARASWTPAQAAAFDAQVVALRAAVDHAPAGEDRERAWQALIDYAQRAVVGVGGELVGGVP